MTRTQHSILAFSRAALHLALALIFPLLSNGGARAQSGASLADLASEADLRFQAGVAAHQRGDCLGALEHYLYSNRLVPNKNVVYNIGRCYEQLGRPTDAFRYYSDYVAEETSETDRAPALQAIERIRARVALARIETTPPGATIFVERRDLGARGLTPRTLALAPGTYRLMLELDGYELVTIDGVAVATGTQTSVQRDLVRILGRVNVGGEPAGAEIRVDDEMGPVVGRVPGRIDLVPGQHTLIISAAGHQPVRRDVTVRPRDTVSAVVSLPLQTGRLVVRADERGVLIEVDGRAMGFAPSVLQIPAGEHELRATHSAYRPFVRRVVVEANGRTDVAVQLRSLEEVSAASRAVESVADAPASVTLVPNEEIRAFGYQTLYQALGGVRGVYQTNDRTYEYLGFRGFSRLGDYGNRVLVLMDGHTMNDNMLGSSYVGRDFRGDLLDVERIEVVRGPGSALYGTNAFFGVVNVVTRDAESLLRPHFAMSTDAGRTASLRAGGGERLGEHGGLWLSAIGTRSQGDDLFLPGHSAAPADGYVRNADSANAATVGGRAWYRSATLEGQFNTRHKRYATGAFETILGDPDAHSDDQRSYLEFRWEPTLGENATLLARAFWDQYTFDGGYPYEGETEGERTVLHDSWAGDWVGGEARLVWQLAAPLKLTVGGEGRTDVRAHLRGAYDEETPHLDEAVPFRVLGAYLVAAWQPIRWLTLTGGGRVDDFSTFGTSVNPRLTAVVRPGRTTTIKFLAGRAFRAPSQYELYYNDGGETQVAALNLDPETILTGEVEITQQLSDALSVLATVYVNEIDQLIDTVPNEDDLLVYRNVDEPVYTVGAEAEARRRWRDGWMASASYAFQRTRLHSPFTRIEERRLTNSPEHLVTLKGAAPLGIAGITFASSLRLESARLTRDLVRAQPVVLWDAVLTGEVPETKVSYAFGVRNLADWQYAHPAGEEIEVTSLPQPGRTVFAQARIAF